MSMSDYQTLNSEIKHGIIPADIMFKIAVIYKHCSQQKSKSTNLKLSSPKTPVTKSEEKI